MNMLRFARRHFSSNTSVTSKPKAALEGIKVLDLTRLIAGPLATQLLGDYGAEVIKVEHPHVGDHARKYPPFFDSEGTMFVGTNRNKKSIAINLKEDKGREIIYKLVKSMDVFVENYVPGDLDRYGLSYQDLSKINPKLIYCSLTAFGQNGPYCHRKGYNLVAEAMTGLMHLTGSPETSPYRYGIAATDVLSGIYAYAGIASALYARSQDPLQRGQRVDCSLYEAGLSALTHASSNYLYGNMNPARIGNQHPNIVPNGCYPTKDSYIILGVWSEHEWSILCDVIGGSLLKIKNDPKFNNNKMRVQNRKEFEHIFITQLQTQTTSYWLEQISIIDKDNVLVWAPVHDLKQAFEHPQTQACEMLIDMPFYFQKKNDDDDDNKFIEKSVPCVGFPIKLSETPGHIREGPPRLGQHTQQILKQYCSYNNQQIEEYEKQGIIQMYHNKLYKNK